MRDWDFNDLQTAVKFTKQALNESEQPDTSTEFKLAYVKSHLNAILGLIDPIVRFEQESNQ